MKCRKSTKNGNYAKVSMNLSEIERVELNISEVIKKNLIKFENK